MARRKQGGTEGQGHLFGGDWTAIKLDILRRYLAAYTQVLKKQRFKTAYIDAFAGTGYRTLRQSDLGENLLFPDLADEASQGLLEGSARMALQIDPRFAQYIFVEKDLERCEQLEKLKREFPHLASDILVRPGEANQVIQDLCGKSWDNHRAVLFLDPYGMQVDWTTIERVARTEAIDLWLLFPLGMGLNRMLPRSGQIPEGWRNRLNRSLGSEDWYHVFYHEHTSLDLFGRVERRVEKVEVERVGNYFIDRLRTVFPGVAPKPKILTNSTGSFLLCNRKSQS